MAVRCIIIEDEPFAQKLLQEYIQKVEFLDLIGIFNNPLMALPTMQSIHIDVIFLDIEMPELNGMDFLNIINPSVKVIFTTAYSQYAIESYEKNALDYLLKPISFERFLKSVQKITKPQSESNEKYEGHIYIKSDKAVINLKYSEIFFIQGLKDYVIFQTSTGKHIVHHSLKKIEKILPSQFVRIHHSYIINFDNIDFIKDNQVNIFDTAISIGKTYKDVVELIIQSKLI